MDYLAEDSKAIKVRMYEIAKAEKPLIQHLDSLQAVELDTVGYGHHVPRISNETDYAYRIRLKEHLTG